MGCPHRLVASLVRAACNPGMASGRAPAGAPRGAQGPRAKGAPALSALEFIGCEAVAMSPEALRRYEGRLEVWDAELATAWMVREPTSPAHERPSQGLAGLVERIGAVHHAPARLECTGVRAPASGNLLRRGMVLPGPATGPRGLKKSSLSLNAYAIYPPLFIHDHRAPSVKFAVPDWGIAIPVER